MKKTIIYVVAVLVLSFLFYKLTIKYLPNVIYSKAKSKMMTQGNIKENEIRILPFPTSESRAVVKPNPDFAYASSFYNLSDGPLHLKGPMPDSTYWSVALYEPNTNNFYVKNDLQYKSNEIDVVIGRNGESTNSGTGKETIVSPTDNGFLLLRILSTKRSKQEKDKLIELLDQLTLNKI